MNNHSTAIVAHGSVCDAGIARNPIVRQAETAVDKFTATLVLQAGGPLKEGAGDLIAGADKAARTLLNSNVQLHEIPNSEKKARTLLQASAAAKPGDLDPQRFVGICLDPVQLGEALTAPHLRHPPMGVEVIKARLG